MALSTVPYALAVDDDAIILTDICCILEDAGFRCHDAANGTDAIALLEERWQEVTVLFTDVEMPGGVSGFDLARHVAEHWPQIEIVVASGRITPQPGDLPEKAAFVAKPFTAEMVHEELRRLLPDGKQPEPLKQAV